MAEAQVKGIMVLRSECYIDHRALLTASLYMTSLYMTSPKVPAFAPLIFVTVLVAGIVEA
jgi:hypothetical protein